MRAAIVALLLSIAAGVGGVSAQSITGMTASGKQVRVEEGDETPWQQDLLKWVPPGYPPRDAYIGNRGKGHYRLWFDLKTGAVSKVDTVRSTGYASLDQAAAHALNQWRVRPGTWRAFEVSINFAWQPTYGAAMSEFRRLTAEKERRKLRGKRQLADVFLAKAASS